MTSRDTLDPLDVLAALDRLAAAIVRLVHALAAPPATLAAGLARTIQDRLAHLAAELLHVGIRLHAAPKPRPTGPDATPPPARPAVTRPAIPPRHPGWLLDALPDTAPAIADEIRAILQDPALAALLTEDPAIRRRLRSLCRMLGLDLASLSPTAPPLHWLPLPHLRAHAPRPPSDPTPHSPHSPPISRKIAIS